MHEIEISIFCEQVICVYCLFSIFCIVCGLDGKKAKWVAALWRVLLIWPARAWSGAGTLPCTATELGPDDDSWCRGPETLTSFVMMIINMYVSFRDWFKTEYSWSIAQLADWIRVLSSTKGVCYLGQLIVTQPAQRRAQYTATTPQPSLQRQSSYTRGRYFIRKVYSTFIFWSHWLCCFYNFLCKY